MSDEEKVVEETPAYGKKFQRKTLSPVDIAALKKINKWREEE